MFASAVTVRVTSVALRELDMDALSFRFPCGEDEQEMVVDRLQPVKVDGVVETSHRLTSRGLRVLVCG